MLKPSSSDRYCALMSAMAFIPKLMKTMATRKIRNRRDTGLPYCASADAEPSPPGAAEAEPWFFWTPPSGRKNTGMVETAITPEAMKNSAPCSNPQPS